MTDERTEEAVAAGLEAVCDHLGTTHGKKVLDLLGDDFLEALVRIVIASAVPTFKAGFFEEG